MYIESHPFDEFIPKGAKSLIVGSFPPVKLTVKDIDAVSGENRKAYLNYFSNKRNIKTVNDIDFYYGSRDNLLWEIISKVFNVKDELKSESEIKNF